MAKPTSAAESTKAKASFKGPCSKGRGPGKYTLLAFLYYIYNGDKVADIKCTVADYRPSTVQLQVKTLLPCILLLTLEIEVIYYISRLHKIFL